jgi:hypothetical protein
MNSAKRRAGTTWTTRPNGSACKQWCADATEHDGKRSFHALFVPQEEWDSHKPGTFAPLVIAFR